MKKIWILTLFPEYFKPLNEFGIASHALKGLRGVEIELKTVQIRDHSPKDFKGVDDAPYGGGPGMVMRADVLENTLLEGVVKVGGYGEDFREKLFVVYTSPRGKVWDHQACVEFAKTAWGDNSSRDLVFLCGRYEGVDERFLEEYVDATYSLGDYVLTGGEIAVMAMIDSAIRFMPGVLGNKLSAVEESFADGLLEHPQYTRPNLFAGRAVPEVLLSGNHPKIESYRQKERVRLTKNQRPDLWEKKK